MQLSKPTLFLTIIAFVVLSACNQTKSPSGNEDKTESEEKTTLLPDGIHRYEKALFTIPADKFQEGIGKIAPEFRVFLGDNYSSAEAVSQLKAFASDRQNKEVYSVCLKKFPDLQLLTEEFRDAFGILLEEVPGIRLPEVYTYVSGYDIEYPVKYADSAMIIALDMYLGSSYEGYRDLGIPLYISQRLTPEHILPDCIKEMAIPLIAGKESPVLIDAMIEEGKILYFADIMLPETADNLKIGFTTEQLKWCSENEDNLWSFLIENELLYSADAHSMSMFMTDGPFTSSFSQESPARTGAWLGWQIVRSYMKKNDIKLAALLADKNAQGILEKSGYKPKRK